jgi:hypothetical protein
MEIIKKTGTTGSTPKLSIKYEGSFTIEELMYVHSYHNTIENLYKKLRLLHLRAKSKNSESYTKWAAKNKIDNRLSVVMKSFGFMNQFQEWNLSKLPSKADAVFLQLQIRQSYKDAKTKKD